MFLEEVTMLAGGGPRCPFHLTWEDDEALENIRQLYGLVHKDLYIRFSPLISGIIRRFHLTPIWSAHFHAMCDLRHSVERLTNVEELTPLARSRNWRFQLVTNKSHAACDAPCRVLRLLSISYQLQLRKLTQPPA